MSAPQLRARWQRSGELTALERVAAHGRRLREDDPAVASVAEREAVRDALVARDELRIRTAAVARHEAELGALSSEIESIELRLTAARSDLERCRQRQRSLEAHLTQPAGAAPDAVDSDIGRVADPVHS
jgi:chromosome segregation ATPase